MKNRSFNGPEKRSADSIDRTPGYIRRSLGMSAIILSGIVLALGTLEGIESSGGYHSLSRPRVSATARANKTGDTPYASVAYERTLLHSRVINFSKTILKDLVANPHSRSYNRSAVTVTPRKSAEQEPQMFCSWDSETKQLFITSLNMPGGVTGNDSNYDEFGYDVMDETAKHLDQDIEHGPLTAEEFQSAFRSPASFYLIYAQTQSPQANWQVNLDLASGAISILNVATDNTTLVSNANAKAAINPVLSTLNSSMENLQGAFLNEQF